MNLDTTLRRSLDTQSIILRTMFALDPDTNMPISTNYVVTTDGIGGLQWLNPFTNLSTAGTGVGYLPSTLNSLTSNLSSLSSFVTTLSSFVTTLGGPLYDYQIASTLRYSDSFSSIKFGYLAGSTLQASNAIAIGNQAGRSNQGSATIALGVFAGLSNQGNEAIAIGGDAGKTNQATNAISLGSIAGFSNQGTQAIAIGTGAARFNQAAYGMALGYAAGYSNQGQYSIGLGFEAGYSNQGVAGIGLGYRAGYSNQGSEAVAIGVSAGESSQTANAVAIGNGAGQNTQGFNSVAIGYTSGGGTQGTEAVAIGSAAGTISQGASAIAIGKQAGYNTQASNSIAIGYQAGAINQSTNSIAIGYRAGYANQAPSSIVMSALTSTLNVAKKGFFVAPIENIEGSQTHLLALNATTSEIGRVAAQKLGYNNNTLVYDNANITTSFRQILNLQNFVWSGLCSSPENAYSVRISWSGTGYIDSVAWYLDLYNSTQAVAYSGTTYTAATPAVAAGQTISGTNYMSGSYSDTFTSMSIVTSNEFYPRLYMIGKIGGAAFTSFTVTLTLEPMTSGF
jgi:hypothetical protein